MSKHNLIIRNANIIDGTGASGWIGDVAVQDDRITAVDTMIDANGFIEIDARGQTLAPGFIDSHTHDDRAVIDDPWLECKLSQGVSTVVVGNCGISLAPLVVYKKVPAPIDLIVPNAEDAVASFADYFEKIEIARPSVNVLAQCGHSCLRFMAMDNLQRPATASELNTMQKMLVKALEEGAAGLSTGLEYPPARASEPDEVVELAKIVHDYGGFYSTHMRDEGANITNSLDESFYIGRQGRVPVIISHHKLAGQPNFGRSHETLDIIKEAQKSQIVSLDAYPYIASSTILEISRVKRASRTIISWCLNYPHYQARDLADIMREKNMSAEEVVDFLTPAGGIYYNMNEEDVQNILKNKSTMIGSDGLPHDSHPHPRLWGTFPKIIGHYSRDIGLFSLEEAIRKMTALPAQTFGIKNRGVIQQEAYADLVLFDRALIKDMATFERPMQPAQGILAVWVNGVMSWSRGKRTSFRGGRGLKRQDQRRLRWNV